MSRGLQWVLGISAVLVAFAVAFAVLAPWILPLDAGYGTGMMGGYGPGTSYGSGMMGGGMMGGYGRSGGYGMMPWAGAPGNSASGARLSMDQARTLAEDYAAAIGSDLAITEVMEFENNFYAVLAETSTGRGAMEVLIDPYTGAVGPEPGPNMMWNEKYGHMSWGLAGANALTLEEARQEAQAALETQLPGSQVHEDGAEFYGYFTFDFDGPDGTIAGMLSVDAGSGAAWLHTWHGDFLEEWEAEGTGS